MASETQVPAQRINKATSFFKTCLKIVYYGSLDNSIRLSASDIIYSPMDWILEEENQANSQLIDIVVLSVLHRSGSTLLQRLCNARRGTLIWGEHGGVLRSFADMYVNAACFSINGGCERRKYFNHKENPNIWIANMTPEMEYIQKATIESARAFINTLYSQYHENHDIIGFKEVTYTRNEIELIRKCYPNASILLLVRNPFDTWNSTNREWYPVFETWIDRWMQNTQYFIELAKTDPNCHFMRYEDLISKEKTCMKILSDVAKITDHQIDMVLAKKIGSTSFGVSAREREMIIEKCGNTMSVLDYL